jgi:hypothetical protein
LRVAGVAEDNLIAAVDNLADIVILDVSEM